MTCARFNSLSRTLPWAVALLLCFCGMCFVSISCSKSYRMNRLIDDLKDADPQIRWEAAKLLGESMDPRAVEPLIAALIDPSVSVRYRAEESLGMIKDLRSIGPLVEALKKNPEGNAAKALEGMDSSAVGPLISALKDAHKNFCSDKLIPKIEETLMGIGTSAVEPLIAALKDNDSRGNAASILGEIKDVRAVQPLVSELKDPDFYFRREVVYALGKIKDPGTVDPLMVALMEEKDPEILGCLGQALGQIGAQALDPLLAALKSSDRMTKGRVAMALGTSKDPRVAAILNDALKRHDLVVIAGAYFYFHKQGSAPNSVLIEALNAHGGTDMAEYFMNSRDAELEKAASDWAGRKGYIMIPTFR